MTSISFDSRSERLLATKVTRSLEIATEARTTANQALAGLQALSNVSGIDALTRNAIEALLRQTVVGKGTFTVPSRVSLDDYSTKSYTQIASTEDNGVFYSVMYDTIVRFDIKAGKQLPDIKIPIFEDGFDDNGYIGCVVKHGRYLVTVPRGYYEPEDSFLVLIYDLVPGTFSTHEVILPANAGQEWGNRIFHQGTKISATTSYWNPSGRAPYILKLNVSATGTVTHSTIQIDCSAVTDATEFWEFELSNIVKAHPTSKFLVAIVDEIDTRNGSFNNSTGAFVIINTLTDTAAFATGGQLKIWDRQGAPLRTENYEPNERMSAFSSDLDSGVFGFTEGMDDAAVDGVYNPRENSVTFAPSDAFTVFKIFVDPGTGTINVHRNELNVAHPFRGDKWSMALYNPIRNSVILVPSRHPVVLEVVGSGPTVQFNHIINLAWPLNQDNYYMARGCVYKDTAYMFPSATPHSRVLNIPLTLDASKPTLSLY
jgi:hypothetical protein